MLIIVCVNVFHSHLRRVCERYVFVRTLFLPICHTHLARHILIKMLNPCVPRNKITCSNMKRNIGTLILMVRLVRREEEIVLNERMNI